MKRESQAKDVKPDRTANKIKEVIIDRYINEPINLLKKARQLHPAVMFII